MKTIYLFFFFFIGCEQALAQPHPCNYDVLRQEAQAALEKDSLGLALRKLNSARRCNPAKGEEINDAIQQVFERLNQQRRTTEKSLSDLAKYAAEAMPVLLDNIEDRILHLEYEKALTDCKTAYNLSREDPPLRLIHSFQEIAFFFTESGAHSKALEALKYMRREPGRLSGEAEQRRLDLRAAIKRIDVQNDAFLVKRYYPEMVPIPGGPFEMGCDMIVDTIYSCTSDERRHSVILTPYKIARTETSVWQYYLYVQAMRDSGRTMPPKAIWAWQGRQPIVNVSWYDAIAYAEWLNQHQLERRVYLVDIPANPNELYGREDSIYWPDSVLWQTGGYRLPTEAEWELAARGPQPSLFAGTSKPDSLYLYANYSSERDSFANIAPVDHSSFRPNGWGLYQMSGNVWEWCWDWYDAWYYRSSQAQDPRGPAERQSYRVLRGGSWYFDPYACRSSHREHCYPWDGSYGAGFRVAQDY